MTAPDELRRNQLIQGWLLVALGVFVALTTFYYAQRDASTRDCLELKVDQLSTAAGARADASEQETAATKKLLLNVDSANSQKEFDKLLAQYKKAIEEVEQARIEHPLPPYPEGTCDGSSG